MSVPVYQELAAAQGAAGSSTSSVQPKPPLPQGAVGLDNLSSLPAGSTTKYDVLLNGTTGQAVQPGVVRPEFPGGSRQPAAAAQQSEATSGQSGSTDSMQGSARGSDLDSLKWKAQP